MEDTFSAQIEKMDNGWTLFVSKTTNHGPIDTREIFTTLREVLQRIEELNKE